VDVVPAPASALIGVQAGTPPEPLSSRQTNPDGHPLVEQSPEWHWSSAPQLLPLGHCEGFVHVVPPLFPLLDPAGEPPVYAQRWSLVHV
jgi:hypothetical protein